MVRVLTPVAFGNGEVPRCFSIDQDIDPVPGQGDRRGEAGGAGTDDEDVVADRGGVGHGDSSGWVDVHQRAAADCRDIGCRHRVLAVPSATEGDRSARSRSPPRRAVPVLASRLATWVSTVRGERNSRLATSALDRPWATSWSTSISRLVTPRARRCGGTGVWPRPRRVSAPARRSRSRQMRAS